MVNIIVNAYALGSPPEEVGTSSMANELIFVFKSTLNILPLVPIDNASSPVPPSIVAVDALTSKYPRDPIIVRSPSVPSNSNLPRVFEVPSVLI